MSAPGNRETREIKASFEVEAEPSKIMELLRSEQQALLWMQGVKEVKILPGGTQNDWYVYLLYNIPWPLNKQDCIIHYRLVPDVGEDQILLMMDGTPDLMDEIKGIDRISHLCGSWRISRTCEGKCRIEYAVFSFQKPKFPRWATDPIVQSNLIRTMNSLKELAENPLKQAK